MTGPDSPRCRARSLSSLRPRGGRVTPAAGARSTRGASTALGQRLRPRRHSRLESTLDSGRLGPAGRSRGTDRSCFKAPIAGQAWLDEGSGDAALSPQAAGRDRHAGTLVQRAPTPRRRAARTSRGRSCCLEPGRPLPNKLAHQGGSPWSRLDGSTDSIRQSRQRPFSLLLKQTHPLPLKQPLQKEVQPS